MTDKETEKLARSFWMTINDNQGDNQANGVLPDLTDEDLRRIYHYMVLLMDEYQTKEAAQND